MAAMTSPAANAQPRVPRNPTERTSLGTRPLEPDPEAIGAACPDTSALANSVVDRNRSAGLFAKALSSACPVWEDSVGRISVTGVGATAMC